MIYIVWALASAYVLIILEIVFETCSRNGILKTMKELNAKLSEIESSMDSVEYDIETLNTFKMYTGEYIGSVETRVSRIEGHVAADKIKNAFGSMETLYKEEEDDG